MIHQDKYQYIRIGLASPEQIRAWSEKVLPTGEIVGRVDRSSTFHCGGDEPGKDGISCQRIFGPIRSGVCSCGKYQQGMEDGGGSRICKDCGVEYTGSLARRYRTGYIELACAVTHVWYLKNVPSYIANILSKPLQELESLAYCDLSFARPVAGKPTLPGFRRGFLKYDEYGAWNETAPCFFHCSDYDEFIGREITTGGDAVREPLASLDPKVLLDRAYAEWEFWASNGPTGDESEDRAIQRGKDFLVRHIRLMKNFIRTKTNPEWMVLSLLPVLPPELRPMVQLGGGKMISSDINELHRRIIFRNNSLGNLLARRMFAPEGVIVCQKKLLQGAVDALLGNGIGGEPMMDTDGRPFKSLSDIVQGKEGRFRENLLGKRVDYSGRSVIVAGPYLPFNQCGLPWGVAVELFQPFMIRSLIGRNLAPSVGAAKALIRRKMPFIWETLQGVMRGRTVLLNRAPTLHRLGIQAFEPVLADGCAIRLHPLVCTGFNADFDGDQMAVHVPLSLEAQAEARSLALSHTNLLSPATGDPISAPNQDMLLGLYILTIGKNSGVRGNRCNPCRQRSESNLIPYEQHPEGIPYFHGRGASPRTEPRKVLELQNPLWLRWPVDDLRIMNPIDQEEPIELQYEPMGTSHQIYEHFQIGEGRYGHTPSVYVRTTAGRLIFNQRVEASLRGIYEDYLSRDAAMPRA
uniref:DNA-directed RNA polymerase subunit gamma n=1 Tax=Selaginella lepidophylla TaxID=59777 RepID=A0A3T0IB56_SELLP|nr:RNA polymerase subunit beta' [Selaginella lepidophylla]AZU95893.1 RNA polymerase subunit beta' [Selaginella lepidophylla]